MLIFSGPVLASTPLEAETLALYYMLVEIGEKIRAIKTIIIHTDSYIW